MPKDSWRSETVLNYMGKIGSSLTVLYTAEVLRSQNRDRLLKTGRLTAVWPQQ